MRTPSNSAGIIGKSYQTGMASVTTLSGTAFARADASPQLRRPVPSTVPTPGMGGGP